MHTGKEVDVVVAVKDAVTTTAAVIMSLASCQILILSE